MIGVFDSGLGGLSSLLALRQQLPEADTVYLADTARLPFGALSPEGVRRAAADALDFFLSLGASSVLFACGTVSALALPHLKKKSPIPLYGILTPSLSAAKALYQGGTIGILGTEATVKSRAFPLALQEELPKASLLSVACPLFVPLVENGFIDKDNPVARAAVDYYLSPFLHSKTDALLLGCTHFSWLAPFIQKRLPRVPLIDCAKAAALAIPKEQGNGEALFFTTRDPEAFSASARFLLKDESIKARQVTLPASL